MQRTIYECDKCAEEMSSAVFLHKVTISRRGSFHPTTYDLCEDCQIMLFEWFKEN